MFKMHTHIHSLGKEAQGPLPGGDQAEQGQAWGPVSSPPAPPTHTQTRTHTERLGLAPVPLYQLGLQGCEPSKRQIKGQKRPLEGGTPTAATRAPTEKREKEKHAPSTGTKPARGPTTRAVHPVLPTEGRGAAPRTTVSGGTHDIRSQSWKGQRTLSRPEVPRLNSRSKAALSATLEGLVRLQRGNA